MELVLSICGKHPSVPRNIFRTVFYSISPCKQFSSHFAKFQRSSHGLPSRSLATQAVCLFSFPQKSSLTEELGSRRRLTSRDSWCLSTRSYSFSGAPKDHRKKPTDLTEKKYHEIADETLESLTTSFEELVDTGKCHAEFDVMCSNGVLTLRLSPAYTYVINKQSPNRQIWLSSPISGPKRYDFVDDAWIYLHDYSNLHELVSKELSQILETPVDFSGCSFGLRNPR